MPPPTGPGWLDRAKTLALSVRFWVVLLLIGAALLVGWPGFVPESHWLNGSRKAFSARYTAWNKSLHLLVIERLPIGGKIDENPSCVQDYEVSYNTNWSGSVLILGNLLCLCYFFWLWAWAGHDFHSLVTFVVTVLTLLYAILASDHATLGLVVHYSHVAAGFVHTLPRLLRFLQSIKW